jgi:hypothetical protein
MGDSTVETLTDEEILAWYASCESKGYASKLTMLAALGDSGGPCYRKPSACETADARARIAISINARAKAGEK